MSKEDYGKRLGGLTREDGVVSSSALDWVDDSFVHMSGDSGVGTISVLGDVSASNDVFAHRRGAVGPVDGEEDGTSLSTGGPQTFAVGHGHVFYGKESFIAGNEQDVVGAKGFYWKAIDTTNHRIYLTKHRMSRHPNSRADIKVNDSVRYSSDNYRMYNRPYFGPKEGSVLSSGNDDMLNLFKAEGGINLAGIDGQDITIWNCKYPEYVRCFRALSVEDGSVIVYQDLGKLSSEDYRTYYRKEARAVGDPYTGNQYVAFFPGIDQRKISCDADAYVRETTFGAAAIGEKNQALGYNSLAVGFENRAEGHYSAAFGNLSKAQGHNSFAAGVKAVAGSNYSFAWNGKNDEYNVSGKERERTFNVNPKDGLSGFYVGDKSLAQTLDGYQPSGDYADGAEFREFKTEVEAGTENLSGWAQRLSDETSSFSNDWKASVDLSVAGLSALVKDLGDGKRDLTDFLVRGNPTDEGSWFTVDGAVYAWTQSGNWRYIDNPEENYIEPYQDGFRLHGAGLVTEKFVLDTKYEAYPELFHDESLHIIGCVDAIAKVSDLREINYVDPRYDVVLAGGLSVAGQTEISGNFRQGVSVTKGTGASCDSEGVPSWTEMEGVRAAALNKSTSLGENSFAANAAAAYGKNSAAFGNSKAFASYSVANGADVSAMGYASHAEGRQTQTGLPEKIGSSSTLQDYGAFAHAEGCQTSAVGMHSHAEGRNSWSEGENSHAEGEGVSAVGYASHAEGEGVSAVGYASHAEGNKSTTESDYSHAEGDQCLTKGESSHAEGYMSTAEGGCSHAEGDQCLAKGQKSHAEGAAVSAIGYASHAEGRDTVAEARCSHAEGACAQALSGHDYSFVWSGRYNPHHNYYKSRDAGTFCINPEGGLSGFYVGDKSLYDIISASTAGLVSRIEQLESKLASIESQVADIADDQ